MGIDRAYKRAIEILWRVRTEGCRRILEHAAGMDQPLIDGERVDKRFECGAGRALRGDAVDLPGDDESKKSAEPTSALT